MSTQYEKPSAENEVNEMGEDPPASGGDRAQSKERTYTSSNRNFEKELIYLKDPIGRKFQFPFKVAKTWHGMESLIEQASNHIDTIGPLIKAGHYDLIGPDGNAILPSVWDQCIEPGWFITMQLWQDAENAKKEAEEVFKKKALDEAKIKAEEAMKKNLGKDQAPIRFKDAVGRKFSFPFHLCKTWMGMEELIKQAFIHVEVIGPHVQAGHYDLIGPNGEIILPQVWEKVIEPDWAISMTMWPMDRPPAPQGPIPRPRPPGMRFPPGARQAGGRAGGYVQPGPPPPPPPALGPQEPQPVTIFAAPSKPAKKSNKNTGVLQWLSTGRRPKGNRKKEPHVDVDDSKSGLLPVRRRGIKGRGPRSATGISLVSSAASDDSEADSVNDQSESVSSVEEELGARQEARQKELIIVCKPSSPSSKHFPAIRRQTIPFLEKSIEAPRRLEISSARVYSEGPLMFQSSLELIRRPKATPPTQMSAAQSERPQLTWLQITRNFMNFQEFEDLAMFDLPQDPLSRRLVNHLFHTIRSRRIDEDWYIRPGTVIRCDTDPTEDRFESALFVALPHLRAQPYNGRSSPKGEGFCRERRLHDAFDQYSSVNLSINQEKGWYSRHDLGSDRNQIFWVGQVWLLLVGQSLLTYGSISVDELEAGNITVQDEIIHAENGDRIIQIVDQDRRLFYIPSSKCKSFYELQVAMIHQFKRLGRADIKEYSLNFHLIDGQEITSSKWSAILKQPDLPLVKVTLSPIEVHHDDTSSLTASRHSRTSDEDKLSLDISEPSGDSDDSSSDEGGSESDSESGLDQEDSKSDSMGFLLIETESIATTVEHSVPNLNRRVPPFLSWLIRATDGKERNIANGFRESIARIELMLIRVDEKQYSDELMESLTSAFGVTDFYDETANMDYEEFKYLRASFHKGKLLRGSSSMSDLSDSSTLKLADEYLDVALLTLESFISIEFQSKLTQKFFGALADVMKDPTFSLQLHSSDAPDPDIPDTFKHEKKLRWVLSRKRIRDYDQREHRQAHEDAKCEECEMGTVYSSMESAIAHFRKLHMVGSMTDSNIRIFVLPLAAALEERLAEEQSSLLQGARDAMVSILRKLVSIQDGVTYDNEFREQRGLPLYLLQATTWIFLYVCSVSRALHELSWFYKDDLCQKDPKNLTSSKIRTQLHYLTRISSKVEDLVRKAERELASPTTAVEENGPGSFLISVGQHYVATRAMCNLLRTPIHNNKHVVPIYQALTKKLASQIIRNPTKRQILSIGALIDQLRLIKDFYEWQRETLYYFDLVINPDSYPRGYDHAEREKLFSDHEYGLISWEDKKLEKDIHQISQLLLACDRMVGKVRELTDIMKDDQGRAIFIFTTVTIIFLPLSFVATYIGMSGGATGLDWSGIQSLFWEVSGPLTFGILMFCLFVAQKENILNAIPLSLVEKMRGWRDWSGWKARGEWETEYESTEKDTKLDTC